MLRVGLTGGIGSGKSEVSRRLAARGAAIVDADVAAREVVEPGTPGLGQIADVFGPEVLRPPPRNSTSTTSSPLEAATRSAISRTRSTSSAMNPVTYGRWLQSPMGPN